MRYKLKLLPKTFLIRKISVLFFNQVKFEGIFDTSVCIWINLFKSYLILYYIISFDLIPITVKSDQLSGGSFKIYI